MTLEVITTADGSRTIYSKDVDATFHSRHGALAESKHIFIDTGLNFVKTQSGKNSLSVLEVGYGSGLNALLAAEYALEKKILVEYTGVDKYEFPQHLHAELNYQNHLISADASVYHALMNAPINSVTAIHESFIVYKIIDDFRNISLTKRYDVVFFDAFSPRQAPEMWTVEIFRNIYDHLNVGAALVTFCAQGQFKRDLKAAGFKVERLPGAPGKREMTRGIKM